MEFHMIKELPDVALCKIIPGNDEENFDPISLSEDFFNESSDRWYYVNLEGIMNSLYRESSENSDGFMPIDTYTTHLTEYLWNTKDDPQHMVMKSRFTSTKAEHLVATKYFRGLMKITRMIKANLPDDIPFLYRNVVLKNFLQSYTRFVKSNFTSQVHTFDEFIEDLKNSYFYIALFVDLSGTFPNRLNLPEIISSGIHYMEVLSSHVNMKGFFMVGDGVNKESTGVKHVYSVNLPLMKVSQIQRATGDFYIPTQNGHRTHYFVETKARSCFVCLTMNTPEQVLALKMTVHDLAPGVIYEFDGSKEI